MEALFLKKQLFFPPYLYRCFLSILLVEKLSMKKKSQKLGENCQYLDNAKQSNNVCQNNNNKSSPPFSTLSVDAEFSLFSTSVCLQKNFPFLSVVLQSGQPCAQPALQPRCSAAPFFSSLRRLWKQLSESQLRSLPGLDF